MGAAVEVRLIGRKMDKDLMQMFGINQGFD